MIPKVIPSESCYSFRKLNRIIKCESLIKMRSSITVSGENLDVFSLQLKIDVTREKLLCKVRSERHSITSLLYELVGWLIIDCGNGKLKSDQQFHYKVKL